MVITEVVFALISFYVIYQNSTQHMEPELSEYLMSLWHPAPEENEQTNKQPLKSKNPVNIIRQSAYNGN